MQYLFLSRPFTYSLVWLMFHIHCKEVETLYIPFVVERAHMAGKASG